MNRERERQRRFEALRGEAPSGHEVEPALAATLRVLAASKPAAAVLQLGPARPGVTHWLLEGLDIRSQLIVVTPCPHERSALAGAFDDDIRLTFHHQDITGFLGDVHRHRFDLVTVVGMEHDPEVPALVRARLADGGLLVLLEGEDPVTSPRSVGAGEQWAVEGYPATPWLLEGRLRLLSRSADGGRPARRGRRKRLQSGE